MFDFFPEVNYKRTTMLVTNDASCEGRCGNTLKDFKCRCDPQCEAFHDCCFDYHKICSPVLQPEITTHPDLFSCATLDRDFPDLGTVMLVNKCPANWSYEIIKDYCENLPIIYMDPAKRLQQEWPVFDQYGENFQNIFCALCNGREFDAVQPWDVSFHYYSKCDNGNELGKVGKYLRFCFPSLTSTCPESYINASIALACESYSNHLCGYKNHHCAICNNANLKTISQCNVNGYSNAALRRLWKFRETTRISGNFIDHPCSAKNTVYDPYTRECRALSCAPGLRINNKTECVTIPPGRANAVDSLCYQRQSSWIFASTVIDPVEFRMGYKHNDSCILGQLNISIDGDKGRWKKSSNFGRYSDKMLLQSDATCNLADYLNNLLGESNEIFTSCDIMSVAYLYMGSNIPTNTSCDGEWFSGSVDDFIPVNFTFISEVYRHKGKHLVPQNTFHLVSYEYDYHKSAFDISELVLVCGEYINLLSSCALIILTVEEYTMSRSPNNTRLIHFRNVTLEEGNYIKYPNGLVQICAESLSLSLPKVRFFIYFGNLELANIVGSSISLCGLIITFGLHCYFKDLRNFHGRSIMSLCGALFLAQLMSLLIASLQIFGWLCVLMGVITHYTWLVAFFWMTIIALNLLQVFLRTRIGGDLDSNYFGLFVVPVWGWLSPLVVVLSCLCLHISVSDNTLFEYNTSSPCWISDPISNFWAFGFPIGLLLLINLMTFLVTVVLACNSQRRSRRLRRKPESLRTLLQDVLLCFKVSSNNRYPYT